MTEEIITDGVDVAGCKYLNKVVNEEPYCNIDEEHLYTCSSDENCYFKQLKRLEQERDELKFENDRYKQLLKGCPAEDEDCGFCEIDKQNKRLKQENKDFETLAKSLYKRIEELEKENEALAFRERLYKADYEASEQENKELKSQRDEAVIAFNNLMLDIVSDIPFTGEIGGERNISIKDHLHQMQKALASLEEIRVIADDTLKVCDDDCGNARKIKLIIDRIDEVLNESN